jgi:hypothetical protein
VLSFIRPCSPTTAKTVPAGDAWLHEPKLDGYRIQVIKEGRRVRLFSRRGNEWTGRMPRVAEALAGIPCRSAVIDAELCLLGAGGTPNFYGLPAAMGARAFYEMAESQGDSRESEFVIQASHWTGGQHGWGSHTRKICDEVSFKRLRAATPTKRLPTSVA